MGGIPQLGRPTATDSPHHRQHYDRSGANEVLATFGRAFCRRRFARDAAENPGARPDKTPIKGDGEALGHRMSAARARFAGGGRLQTPKVLGNEGSPQATKAGTRKFSAFRP